MYRASPCRRPPSPARLRSSARPAWASCALRETASATRRRGTAAVTTTRSAASRRSTVALLGSAANAVRVAPPQARTPSSAPRACARPGAARARSPSAMTAAAVERYPRCAVMLLSLRVPREPMLAIEPLPGSAHARNRGNDVSRYVSRTCASSARRRIPSLRKAVARWSSTVRGLRYRHAAISLLVRPAAAASATSRSRGVRSFDDRPLLAAPVARNATRARSARGRCRAR